MDALLFFKMLASGRQMANRQLNRQYYQLCMVAAYPTYTEESKRDLVQHFYDASLSPADWAERERVRREMRALAEQSYKPTSAGLAFFKAQKRDGG